MSDGTEQTVKVEDAAEAVEPTRRAGIPTESPVQHGSNLSCGLSGLAGPVSAAAPEEQPGGRKGGQHLEKVCSGGAGASGETNQRGAGGKDGAHDPL